MPWITIGQEETKRRFIDAVLKEGAGMSALCLRFGISRECGYKWWRRFRAAGDRGLVERARCSHRAQRLGERWCKVALALRRTRGWGPLKLHRMLRTLHPRARMPSVRTLGRWLRQAGLSARRPQRAKPGPVRHERAPPAVRAPNDLWTIDFKGVFRTGDGQSIGALTVRDQFSRQILAVRHLPGSDEAVVGRYLHRLFRRFGLPRAIHVDNGPPFGGSGPLGLSRLSAGWLQLGIRVEFSRPGCPQDNGAHEQMHRVLKKETARPSARTVVSQQQRFDRWRRQYNQQRPHQALGQRCPQSLYRCSTRVMPKPLPSFIYPTCWSPARPDARGRWSWNQRQRLIGRAFAGLLLGLRPRSGQIVEVYFGPHLLGTLHPSDSAGLRPVQRLPPK